MVVFRRDREGMRHLWSGSSDGGAWVAGGAIPLLGAGHRLDRTAIDAPHSGRLDVGRAWRGRL